MLSERISEKETHLRVMEWVRLHPSISPYVIHIPNESPRHPRYGALLKRMGMRKGVADLFIALPLNGYGGAWIELKTLKGKTTASQNCFLRDMKKAGYFVAVTRGIDETIETIKEYCKL